MLLTQALALNSVSVPLGFFSYRFKLIGSLLDFPHSFKMARISSNPELFFDVEEKTKSLTPEELDLLIPSLYYMGKHEQLNLGSESR
jgi:hypothetical protein